MPPKFVTLRWPASLDAQLRAYQADHVGLESRTAAVLHLMTQALTEAGYPPPVARYDSSRGRRGDR